MKAIVGIMDDWANASRGGGFQTIVVDGAAGSGRTFVLQQAYKLFARRTSGGYWPAEIQVGDDRDRDLVAPDFVPPAEARLNALWLGVGAEPGRFALEVMRSQLVTHGQAIEEALKLSGLSTSRAAALAGQATLLAASLVSMGPVGPAAGLALQMLGILAGVFATGDAARKAWEAETVRIEDALRQKPSLRVDPGAESRAEEAAKTIAESLILVSKVVPIVIVVDDAEDLDTVTVSMLKGLSRSRDGGRGLLVLAADLGARRTNPALKAWLTIATARENTKHYVLSKLGEEDLAELAARRLGDHVHVDAAALAKVVEFADGAPGRLVDLLGQAPIRDPLLGRGELPVELSGATRDRHATMLFNHLPQRAQAALARLAVSGPMIPFDWLQPVHGPALTGEDQSAAFHTGWVANEPGVVRFTSQRLYLAARRAMRTDLSPAEIHDIRNRLLARLNRARNLAAEWAKLAADIRLSLLSSLVGGTDQDDPSLVAELVELRRELGLTGQNADMADALRRRLATGLVSPSLVRATAEALLDADRTKDAIEVLTAELQRVMAKHGQNAPAVVPVLEDLAIVYADAAHRWDGHPEAHPLYQKAIQLYRQVLTRRRALVETLGDPRYIETHWGLTRVLASDLAFSDDEGVLAEAATTIGEMEASAHYGVRHPTTLLRRSYLAYWTGQAGQPAKSRDLYLSLVPDMEVVLGTEHPETLINRGNHAARTGEAGKPAKARDLLTDLLPAINRVLGPDHPVTLANRNNLSIWTDKAGDPATAGAQLTKLPPDQERALGPDHPDTLRGRHNIASMSGRAGEPARARDLLLELLPAQEGVLGPDHPDTLATRHGIANWTGEAGDPAKARDLLADLLHDRRRVLGRRHPDTLATRYDLANWTGEAGDPAKARDLFRKLLRDTEGAFGPDHPDTLATRNNLAHWTGGAGDPAKARDLFRKLLRDKERVLGADHPNTLSTRDNLAGWTGVAGDPAKARDLFRKLLRDTERALGPDHPDTLTARENVAYWAALAG